MPPRGLGGRGLQNHYTTGPQKEQHCATFVITPRFVEGEGDDRLSSAERHGQNPKHRSSCCHSSGLPGCRCQFTGGTAAAYRASTIKKRRPLQDAFRSARIGQNFFRLLGIWSIATTATATLAAKTATGGTTPLAAKATAGGTTTHHGTPVEFEWGALHAFQLRLLSIGQNRHHGRSSLFASF